MRVLVLSDIHGNDVALEAILANAPTYDAAWCLGDLVGYGPGPNECVERVRQLPELICLTGNHDHAALGIIALSRFNSEARSVVEWTTKQLSRQTRSFLKSLPSSAVVEDFTLVHGSPRQPVWEYVMDPRIADLNFREFSTPYCLIGHSHFPIIFHRPDDESPTVPIVMRSDHLMELSPRMMMNPGSAGQPRDTDPRASYAILDTEAKTWEIRRVRYDIKKVQERMLEAGLPARQAIRLSEGW
jgi:diadenosine tetraphosphatase ApaH/serine/threonine PP2A family protein phosphatase